MQSKLRDKEHSVWLKKKNYRLKLQQTILYQARLCDLFIPFCTCVYSYMSQVSIVL